MEQLLNTIQGALSSHLAGIIVAVICIIVARYLKRFMELIEDKFNIEIDDKAEQYLMHIVRKAVRIVWGTYVKEKKKDGSFDATAKKEALYKAVDLISAEARRVGLADYVDKKDIVNDIESELVKVKNYSCEARSNFAKTRSK